MRHFGQLGLQTLEAIGARRVKRRMCLRLAVIASSGWLDRRVPPEMETIEGSSWPVMRFNIARSALRVGQIDRAETILGDLAMIKSGVVMSVPVRLKVVESLGRLVDPAEFIINFHTLGNQDDSCARSPPLRWGAWGTPCGAAPDHRLG